MTKVVKKAFPAARKFVLRSDASVEAGEKTIERVFGLPKRPLNSCFQGGRTLDLTRKSGRS